MARLASLLLLAALLGCDHLAPAPVLPDVGCWLLDWDGPQPKDSHIQLLGTASPDNPARLVFVWLDTPGEVHDIWWYAASTDSLYLGDQTKPGPAMRFKRIYTTAPKAAGVTDWSGIVAQMDSTQQVLWTANGKLTRQVCPEFTLR